MWKTRLGGRVPRRRKKALLAVLAIGAALIVFPSLSGAVAISPPDVTTDPASAVTSTSATLNGTINPNDPDTGADYTFSWGTTTSYGTDVTGTTAPGITAQGVSEPITGLTPGTTYHYQLCASNLTSPLGGTTCGNDESFTTPGPPTATTVSASSITQTGATLNGTVDPNGDSTDYTFNYGTTSGSLTNSTVAATVTGTSPQSVSKSISGLSPQTTYYYQLCATNTYGSSCGIERSFFTPDVPAVTTGDASAITQTGATLNGTVDPNGAAATYVFHYGTTSGSLTSSTSGTTGSGTGAQAVSKTISSLSSGTTYYFQLCATNAISISPSCGVEKSFFTASPPTVTTSPASAITTTGATLNGTVNPNGDATDYTFSWGTSPGSYTANSGGSLGALTTAQSVSLAISGLLPHTTYYFKLCATNSFSVSPSCGIERSFFAPDVPTVTTGGASAITQTGATLAGTVNANGDATSYTFSYGTSSGSYTGSTVAASAGSGTTAQSVSKSISGLSPQTTYYYRLCATNSHSGSPSCGAENTFFTPDVPAVTTGDVSAITQTGATLNGTVDPNGAATTYTFSYGTTSGSLGNPGGGTTGSGTGPQAVSRTISSLSPGTTYYYRLCATNAFSGGIPSCGVEKSFFTTSPPTVTTSAASSITPSGATLNGTVNPNGDATNYTFSWGTSPGAYTANSGGSLGALTTAQSVSLAISGAFPHTTYYFTLCATNGTGQRCGVERSFFTPDVPTVTTGLASAITQTSATLAGTVNPNGDATNYTFNYGTTSGSLTSSTASTSAGSGTTAQSVSKTISSLSPATTYYYRLCATNSFSVSPSCGAENTFSTPDAPTAVTGAATAVTTSGATLAGTVNPNGAAVSSAFFKYGTTVSYGSTASATPNPGSGRAPVAVSATLSGLQAGTTFHYTLCATNAYGSPCGADQTFKTNAPPTATLTADKTSGPAPLLVTFNGSQSTDADGSIQTWTLTFGDTTSTGGSGVPGSTIAHTYTNPGSYPAKLTVTDNQGATASATWTVTVSVNQPPIARLTVAPTAGTTPVDVTFDGSASSDSDDPIVSWTLDFGDGTTTGPRGGSPPASFTHTYTLPPTQTTPQTFTAHLSLIDAGGVHSTSDATASVTVNPEPSITLNDVTVTEGNTGTKQADFTLGLTATSTHDITVDYATADGTATSADYNPIQGTLTIPALTSCPSSPLCKITVQVIGDTLYEGTETFTLKLSNPHGATITRDTATGTIIDNDQPPVLMVANAQRLEGNAGTTVSGAQIWGAGGSLTVAAAGVLSPGATDPIFITTPGSPGFDGPYTFTGKSGNTLTGVSPAGRVTAGQIASQPIPMIFNVLLCDAATSGSDPDHCVPTTSGSATTVQYTTVDGVTANAHLPVKAGQDYIGTTGTVTINPGASTAQLTVLMIGNTTPQEATRWFFAKLTSAVGGVIRSGLGTGLIIDDDAPNPPSATTGDASVIETNQATVGATVNALNQATTVYVEYGKTTAYGSKTANQVLTDNIDHVLSFNLTGLLPGTTYHYRVVASHDADNATGYGLDKTITTSLPPPPPPPPSPPPPPTGLRASTGAATDIGTTVATIHGSVNPGGAATTVYVEYGKSGSYGLRSAPKTLTAGSTNQPLTFVLKKLISKQDYHYRLVASHVSEPPVSGNDATFTTNATPMSTTLVTRSTTATATGWIAVTLKCRGNVKPRCRGTVFLDNYGTPAGRATFSITPGKHTIRIKLTPAIWRLTKSKGRLRVDVATSTPDGVGDVTVDARGLMILAPHPAKRRSPHK